MLELYSFLTTTPGPTASSGMATCWWKLRAREGRDGFVLRFWAELGQTCFIPRLGHHKLHITLGKALQSSHPHLEGDSTRTHLTDLMGCHRLSALYQYWTASVPGGSCHKPKCPYWRGLQPLPFFPHRPQNHTFLAAYSCFIKGTGSNWWNKVKPN